jgi:hypothetical protein
MRITKVVFAELIRQGGGRRPFCCHAAESVGNRPLRRMINHEENAQATARRHHERTDNF